jgi:hypothetical protein
MKHSALSSLSVLSLFIGTLTLVGCGGAASFSNPGSTVTTTPDTPQVVTGTPINGTVYGGHAPIQGQHVYLVQPGTTGYGSLGTSIITAANSNTSDPNVPLGAQYVITDSGGNFNTGAYTCVVGRPVYVYSWGGNIGGTGAVNNNNIVQLATLGNCPSSGNFYTSGNGALQFIYLNEVSTVATAYTFQPFTLVTNNDAWHIGTSNTTQGLLGIANAANTAAQLYDIQGGTQLSSCTGGSCGEGHLANFATQLSGVDNQGNGVVPQATIDSLANILSDCVDSVPSRVGTITSQCNSLFTVARDDGTTRGTEPTDTATAAINIARFPAGNSSSNNVDATYASDIFALQANSVSPYVPELRNAPHEWTIAINYPDNAVDGYPNQVNPNLGAAESIAVDNIGQIWITAQTQQDIVRWSNMGDRNSIYNPGYIAGYVSVDGGNNSWAGSAASSTPIFFIGANGVFQTTYGSGYQSAYTVITNNPGDAFFFAQTSATAPNYAMFEYLPGGTLAPGSPFSISGTTTTATITSSSAFCLFGCIFTFHAPNTFAAGDTVNLTLTNSRGGSGWQNLDGNQTIATANATTFTVDGTAATTGSATGTATFTTPGAIPPGENVAHGAIDSDGDMWLTTETSPYTIARVTPTGTAVFPRITTVQQPEFPAIDNGGNAWIPLQETTAEIYKVSPTGGQTVLTSNSTGAQLTSSFGAAVDGNGNVWVTNRCGNYGACGNTAGENSIVVINGGGSTPGTANTAISPPARGTGRNAIPGNYIPEAQYPADTATTFTPILDGPLNLAIDPSGNVWITNYTGGGVVELVGAAAPVATPLSVAAANNQLGAKP